MDKLCKWKIEKQNSNSNLKSFGEFIGTQECFNELKRAVEIYIDSEEGRDQLFTFAKQDI